ncbi:MAG: fimbrial protein [Hafnia sp.]
MKKFKTSLISTTLCTSLLFSVNSLAADGTITFSGSVTASACTTLVGVSSSGSTASVSPTITLPAVTATTLAASGTYAGHTTFTISLTGCASTSALNNVRTLFTTSSPATTDNFVMENTAISGADNVGIAILNSTGTQIDLNGGTSVDAGKALPTTSGAVTLSYQAAYKALSTGVTAGPVTGKTDYVISYF